MKCLINASKKSVPSQKVGFQKFWWNEQLDELKASTIEATSIWRCAGCPRSGPVNDNRLQCKYKYKLAIKTAAAEADRSFNDDLYYKLSAKDNQAFWKSWRQKFCSHSLKCTNMVNGQSGQTYVTCLRNIFSLSIDLTLLMQIYSIKVKFMIGLHRNLIAASVSPLLTLTMSNAVLIR